MDLKQAMQEHIKKGFNDPIMVMPLYQLTKTTSESHASYVGKSYRPDEKIKEGRTAIFTSDEEDVTFCIFPVDSVIVVKDFRTLAILSGSREFVFKY